MPPEQDAAAVILGLVTYYIYDHRNPRAPNYEAIGPFIAPLQRTFEKFEHHQLPNGLPEKPGTFDPESVNGFYRQLIVENHHIPNTPFHQRLFEEIVREDVVKDTIKFLRDPGWSNAATKKASNNLIRILISYLIPLIKEDLEIYLEHHVKLTPGIERAANILGVSNPERIDDKKTEIAQQLAFYVIGVGNIPAYNGESIKSLVDWALKHGWVTVKDNVHNMLSDVLLGPRPSVPDEVDNPKGAARNRRRRGAIIQGLIHWYFKNVIKFPFVDNAYLPFAICRACNAAAPILISSDLKQFICSKCENIVNPDTLKITILRSNIAGKFLKHGDSKHQAAPNDITWKEWRLWKCPSGAYGSRLMKEAAIEAGKGRGADGEEIYEVLDTRKPCDALDNIRKQIVKKIKQLQKPDMTDYETKQIAVEILKGNITDDLSKRVPDAHNIAFDIYQSFIERRNKVLQETHFLQRGKGEPCTIAPTLVSDSKKYHAEKSQRHTTFYIPIDGRVRFRDPDRRDDAEDDSPDGDAPDEATIDDSGDADHAEPDLNPEELIPYIKQFLATRPSPKAKMIFESLGSIEENTEDKNALQEVAQKISQLISWWADSGQKHGTFEQKAASVLKSMWDHLVTRGGILPWKNVRDLSESIVEILEALVALLAGKSNV